MTLRCKHTATCLLMVFLSGGIFTGIATIGCHTSANGDSSAGDSYFPMAEGNNWIFASFSGGQEQRRDTVWIDSTCSVDSGCYYRLRAPWPGCAEGLWVLRDKQGNVQWAASPSADDPHTFLQLDAEVGQRWPSGLAGGGCVDTLAMFDDYAVVATPAGLFDGAREIGAVNACADYGWGISLGRGVGPVSWVDVTIAGARTWLLVSASVHDDQNMFSAAPRVVNGE